MTIYLSVIRVLLAGVVAVTAVDVVGNLLGLVAWMEPKLSLNFESNI